MNNWFLLFIIRALKPDLIVITGDLINFDYYNENSILVFMGNLKKLAPLYYVTGNHEVANKDFTSLEQKLSEMGIMVLRNSGEQLERNGDIIYLMGIDDPINISVKDISSMREYLTSGLNKVLYKVNASMFKILLSHSPEQFPLYREYKIDLTFSGHAHGGQIRLPFIGGLFAPVQGLFPRYTKGTRKKTLLWL